MLTDILHDINEFGTFNCIFSDGEYLFCYHTEDERGRPLFFVQRRPPYDRITLRDEDWEVNLQEEKDPSQEGFIIATECLTDEHWQQFEPGELKVFKNGNMEFFSSRQATKSLAGQLGKVEQTILKILRESPHRLSLAEITVKLKNRNDEVRVAVKSLLEYCLIRQDSRDTVDWDNKDATFFTNQNKLHFINRTIRDQQK